jgi:hypothetical protein
MYLVWFVVVTLFFLAPMGFHHMLRFGIVPFLFLDGESTRPGERMWGDYAVHFSPWIFAATLVLWITCLIAVYRWLRYLDSKAYVS